MVPPTDPEASRSRCVESETQMTGVSCPQRMDTHCSPCGSTEGVGVEEGEAAVTEASSVRLPRYAQSVMSAAATLPLSATHTRHVPSCPPAATESSAEDP
jgi:hypothetical protein